MTVTKSKPYTVDGKQYAFGFDSSGKVNSVFNVSGRSGKKNPVPVDPNTSAFSDIVNSENGTRAYNVNKFKGNTDSYLKHDDGDRAVQATASELNQEYTKNSKSNTNKQFIEEENTNNDQNIAVKQDASPKSTKSEVLSYPFDLNPKQDHFKIMRYNYIRPDINQSKGPDQEIARVSGAQANKQKNMGTIKHQIE